MRSVYVETTVVSYLTARRSRNIITVARQEATQELWPKLTSAYESYVSALVYEEAGKGDPDQAKQRLLVVQAFKMLDVDDAAKALARKIIEDQGIPAEYPEDAIHIAVAAINGMDVLITWNFSHLNNPFTRMLVRQIVENAGYRCPEICSPDELLEVER